MTDVNPRSVPRITVAIDASRRSLQALRTAADVAARVQAHLMALFVEDVNLFSLAQLPFASELDRASGNPRRLDADGIARAVHADVERVRQLLHAESERHGITTSLKVVRGHYVAAAMEAAGDTDMVFLSSTTRTFEALGVVARTRRRAVNCAEVSKLTWTMFDGSPAADRALALARDFSAKRKCELVIMIPDHEQFESLHRKAQSLLGASPARYAPIAALEAEEITKVMAAQECALFVLPRGESSLCNELPTFLLDKLTCPLVMVS